MLVLIQDVLYFTETVKIYGNKYIGNDKRVKSDANNNMLK